MGTPVPLTPVPFWMTVTGVDTPRVRPGGGLLTK